MPTTLGIDYVSGGSNAADLDTLINARLDQIDALIDARITKALYDAHSILAATSDNTPAALTVAEQRLIGRITGGNIAALTAAQILALLDVPTGGAAGDVLGKASGTDYDFDWLTPTALNGVRAYRNTTAQSIPNNTHTAVNFNAENYDDATFHDNSTDPWKFTIPATGRYDIKAQIEFAFDVTGTRQITIWLNPTVDGSFAVTGGTRLAQMSIPAATTNSVALRPFISTMYDLTAADVIAIVAYHDEGAALNANTGLGSTWCSIQRIK